MRGLTPEEREVLRELARPGDDAVEVADDAVPIRRRLTERGLVKESEEREPIDDEWDQVYDVWTITDLGRLALRVCT